MVNIEEGKKIEKEAKEIATEMVSVLEAKFNGLLNGYANDGDLKKVVSEIAFMTLINKANRDSRIVYISKLQLKGLLDGKIQGIDRLIPVDTEQKTTKIRIERSD